MATNVKGHQTIGDVALGSAAPLTVPNGTERAWLQCSGGNVRYTLDGSTTPTASVGMIIVNGAHQPTEISVTAGLKDMKVIKESGTVILQITYFG